MRDGSRVAELIAAPKGRPPSEANQREPALNLLFPLSPPSD